MKLLNDDPDTSHRAIGEIGTNEEEAAAWIKANCKKPVVAFIAGRTAPEAAWVMPVPSYRAKALQEKMAALRQPVSPCESPAVIGATMKQLLG